MGLMNIDEHIGNMLLKPQYPQTQTEKTLPNKLLPD